MENYNLILETIDISDDSGVAEPVTVQEMKDYLRLNGFIDDNDSTSIDDFTDDDTLIEEFITTARQSLEQELNISIVAHIWQAIGVTNQAGNVQLKYGPVTELLSIENSEGDTYDVSDTDEVRIYGDFLKYPNDCDMTVEYTAGFTTIPKAIITEIKRIVAYMYENRGEEDGLEGYKYSQSIYKYSRQQLFH